MLHATDRRTGKIIAAGKASSYGDYRCPTCRARVNLRAGQYRVAHFAHLPGQGKPECELFHPSDNLAALPPFPAPSPAAAIDPLELSIELAVREPRRNLPRNWAPRLTLPKSDDGLGEIMMDFGGGDIRKIPLVNLVLSGRAFPIDPAAPDYGATWIGPAVSPSYRAAVQHRIPGLNPRTPTVFSVTRQKQKPRSRAVHWGESCYLVWPVEFAPAFPQGLFTVPLADHRGWSCFFALLPDQADPEIAAWFENVCDVVVARPRKAWVMVYPPAYAIDDEGNIKTPISTPLLVAVKPVDDGSDVAGEIACASGPESGTVTLSGTGSHFVEISSRGGERLYLTWDETPLANLVQVPHSQTSDEPAVILDCEIAGEKWSLPLHDTRSGARLESLRSAGGTIARIRGPCGVVGELRCQHHGQPAWDSSELRFEAPPAPNGLAVLEEEPLARINDALCDRYMAVALDFGAFGACASCAARPESKTRLVVLRRDLRQRLAWLCQAAGPGHIRPTCNIDAAGDAALIEAFSGLTPPPFLIAHHRALAHELRTLGVCP